MRPASHWLLLLGLTVLWGSSFLLVKIAVASVPPSHLVTARLGIGALALFAFLLASGRRLPRLGPLWLFFLAMAIAGNCLPFWLIGWGQQRIDSGLSGILIAFMPLATVLLAHFLVGGERLTPPKAAGFGLGLLGIVVLVGPEALLELGGASGTLLSQLAVLGAALSYAVAAIIARRRPPGDVVVAAAGVVLVASLVMLPAAALSAPLTLPTPAAAMALLLLGLLSTGLATVISLKLVTLAGPSFMALVNYLIPFWALLVGYLFLGERPRWSSLAALAFILAGIALSERRPACSKAGETVGSP